MGIKKKFHGEDVVTIVLSGAWKDRRVLEEMRGSLVGEKIKDQLAWILVESRDEIPLIKEHFCFDREGAIPYSETLSKSWEWMYGSMRTFFGGDSRDIIRPHIIDYAQEIFKEDLISQEDYKVLQNLGSKLEIKSVVYEEANR